MYQVFILMKKTDSHLNTLRMQYAQVANDLADNGKKEEAKNLLEKCDKIMLQENFPYGWCHAGSNRIRYLLSFYMAAYKAGDTVLAKRVSRCIT